MTKALSIIFSDSAQEDLTNLWCYIALDNPDAADRVLAKLVGAAERLAAFPKIGKIRPLGSDNLRAFPVLKFLLIYTVEGEVVHIVRVLHGMRDIDAVLKESAGKKRGT